MNSNKVRSMHWYIAVLLCFLSTSCVQYKYVLKNDPHNPTLDVKNAHEEIEKGDWVTVIVNKRQFSSLEIQSIDDKKMIVRQYSSRNEWKEHTIYLEYVEKVVLQDLELTYPIGGPLTALIVIMFLLV